MEFAFLINTLSEVVIDRWQYKDAAPSPETIRADQAAVAFADVGAENLAAVVVPGESGKALWASPELVATETGGVWTVSVDPDYTPPEPAPDPLAEMASPHAQEFASLRRELKSLVVDKVQDPAVATSTEADILAVLEAHLPQSQSVINYPVMLQRYVTVAYQRRHITEKTWAALHALIVATPAAKLIQLM